MKEYEYVDSEPAGGSHFKARSGHNSDNMIYKNTKCCDLSH